MANGKLSYGRCGHAAQQLQTTGHGRAVVPCLHFSTGMTDLDIKPIWDEVELPEFPPLSRDVTVDVAVIGGGITGITTALLLQEAGHRVALLERRQMGGVEHRLHDRTPHRGHRSRPQVARRTLGHDHAQAVWDAGLAAIDQIERLVTDYGIACEFDRVPGFRHVAPEANDKAREDALDVLRAEAALARDMGFDVEMVAAAPLGAQPGWRIDDQALFHPRKYLEGTAVAAHRRRRGRVQPQRRLVC